MDFINLNRRFRLIDAEKPFELTDWEAFGFDRGLDWPALLKRPRVLAALFGRHRGLAAGFDGLSVETLRRIIATAYEERGRPVAADVDDDEDSSSSRDRFDEAGGTALTALLERDGPDAHQAMIDLAHEPVVGESAHRLMELAYEMAERQAERSAWSPDEVRGFETRLLAPVASGADLYGLALETLDNIQRSFDHDDLSDRAVVRAATLEHEVQDWLGAAIIGRSGGRAHAVKEAEVVAVKRPDLLLAAVGSSDQLAIEVKHAERGWTYKTLRKALEVQLVRQYLRPRNRRHGVLVITNHRAARYWIKDGTRLSFAELIDDLRAVARAVRTNETGPVWVDVCGIDASEIDR
jgi:hypothetical protein